MSTDVSFIMKYIFTDVLVLLHEVVYKTVVTCKIKHLQKCFIAIDFPQLYRGRKNVKMLYFTCNHGLSFLCEYRLCVLAVFGLHC